MKAIILSLLLFVFALPVRSQYRIPYNLNKPDKLAVLPEILNEVSGLTDVSATQVACVQDELGTVFIYDFTKNNIVARHEFGAAGDFEGLTFTGKSLFILRSDGQLTEWKNFNPVTGKGIIVQQTLPLITANNEGLCFDTKLNRLLIAAKSKPMNHDLKYERLIYAFDLKTKQLSSNPVYSINTERLTVKAREFNIVQNDTTPKGIIKPMNFRPSSLAVHPQTDRIYIISAIDRLLLVMNRNGEIEYMEQLSPDLFIKAEGITFLADGTMIITNEAASKAPTLLLFRMKK